jgi:hypothetical protein
VFEGIEGDVTCVSTMMLGSLSAGCEVRISWCGSTKLTTRSASTESIKYRARVLNSMFGGCDQEIDELVCLRELLFIKSISSIRLP